MEHLNSHVSHGKTYVLNLKVWTLQRFFFEMVLQWNIRVNATRFAVSVNEDQARLPTFYWLPKLHKKHISLDLLLIIAQARLPNYPNC